jgi:hypothetical protein
MLPWLRFGCLKLVSIPSQMVMLRGKNDVLDMCKSRDFGFWGCPNIFRQNYLLHWVGGVAVFELIQLGDHYITKLWLGPPDHTFARGSHVSSSGHGSPCDQGARRSKPVLHFRHGQKLCAVAWFCTTACNRWCNPVNEGV